MGRRYFFLLVVRSPSNWAATPYESGTINVILIPPGVEYKQDTGKVLDELGNVIPKRTFWSTIRVLVLIYPELHWVVS